MTTVTTSGSRLIGSADTPRISVPALWNSVRNREKSIASGASDYITKPVDTDQLLSLMRVWLYR